MFLTWRIWRLMRYPQHQHDFFQRITGTPDKLHFGQIILAIVLVGTLFTLIIAPLSFVLVLLLWAAVPFLLLLFNGTLLGAFWCGRISGCLARQRRRQQYELLALTPRGAVGTSWQIGLSVVHTRASLRRVNRIVRALSGFSLAVCVVGSGIVFVSLASDAAEVQRNNQIVLLQSLLPFGAFGILLWLDHLQSTTSALVLSLLIPTWFADPLQAHLFAIIGYLVLQFGSFSVGIIGIVSLRLLIGALASPLVSDAITALWAVVLIYLLREAALGLLLRALLWRYDLTLQALWESLA